MERAESIADITARLERVGGRLKDFREKTGITYADLAIDINNTVGGVFTRWMLMRIANASYERYRNLDSLLSLIEKYLDLQRNHEVIRIDGEGAPIVLPEPDYLVETRCVVKTMRAIINTALSARCVALIGGKAGLGKSLGMRYLLDEIPDAAMVMGRYTHGGQKPLISGILRTLGIREEKWSVDKGINLAVDSLQKSPRTLVIDDAHFLKVPGFAHLITIREESNCGLVLDGQPGLLKLLKGRNSDEFERFESRCVTGLLKAAFLPEEIREIAKPILGSNIPKLVVNEITERANTRDGHLRTALTETFIARKLADKQGRAVQVEDIHAAATIFIARNK